LIAADYLTSKEIPKNRFIKEV
jgi:hypothetical protein